ncbi:MAG: methyltransferase domain-containing protein [Pyrobaculum sp.]
MSLFDLYAGRYDRWYVQHVALYASELEAAKSAGCEGGVEVGVGTGRFASPLGLRAGLDPSVGMLRLAPRDLDLIAGVGERLPFRDEAFPCALLVVTLCFVEDPAAVLQEAARAAKRVAACIVPRDSPWGRRYVEEGARGHVFYSKARFYTVAEVVAFAEMAGLRPSKAVATLSYPPEAGERYEKPREVSLQEAERFGFVCVEFIKM